MYVYKVDSVIQNDKALHRTCAKTQTCHELMPPAMLEVAKLLGVHVGYSDTPMHDAELRGKAKFLLEGGWRVEDVRTSVGKYAPCLDDIRPGDILEILDAASWGLQGFDGCLTRPASSLIKILEYNAQSAVAKAYDAADSPRTLRGEVVYGKVELPNFWFNIRP